MNSLRLAVLALACLSGSLVLPAAEAGADVASALFTEGKPASLEKGTEAFRAYTGGAVVLRLNSTPAFGAQPSDWAVVQVGPLALAFIQVEGKGRVGVLRGTETSLLPEQYPLDADGRASGPIEIILGCDPFSGTLVYSIGGKVAANSAQGGVASPVEVSLAAGESASWEIADLEVSVIGLENTVAQGASAVVSTSTAIRSAALTKVLEALRASSGPSDKVLADDVLAPAANPAVKPLPRDYVPLSISTPPAVRRSAAEVRAAVAQTLTR